MLQNSLPRDNGSQLPLSAPSPNCSWANSHWKGSLSPGLGRPLTALHVTHHPVISHCAAPGQLENDFGEKCETLSSQKARPGSCDVTSYSENCVSLPLLSPRNESCLCLKITAFTPWQNDGHHIDITFSYSPEMASFSRGKAHTVVKAICIVPHKAHHISWKPKHVYKRRVGWNSYIKSWPLKLISCDYANPEVVLCYPLALIAMECLLNHSASFCMNPLHS